METLHLNFSAENPAQNSNYTPPFMKHPTPSKSANPSFHLLISRPRHFLYKNAGFRAPLCLLFFILSFNGAQAQTNTNSWISTSPDSWSTGPSWSLGAVPNSDQAVFITNGARVTASFGSAAYSLTLGGASGNSEFTVGIGATLAVTTDFTLAPGAGGGTLRLNGGTITLDGGAGKVLNGGGAGVALFSLGGDWTNSMGWSEANVDLVSQAFGSTNTLVITNGQIYNVGDAVRSRLHRRLPEFSVVCFGFAGQRAMVGARGGTLDTRPNRRRPSGVVRGALVRGRDTAPN
jgi:hypothetical protein